MIGSLRHLWARILATAAVLAWAVGASAGEHPSEHPAAASPVPAQATQGSGALDGKEFHGQLVAAGKAEGDADEIEFEAGQFESSACVQHGFGKTPYTTTEGDGGISFAAEARNASGETMSWKGTVKDGVATATAVHRSSNGEKEYAFQSSAKSEEVDEESDEDHGEESEHPSEHPK